MLQVEVLIGEFVAIDRFSASAIVIGEITTLTHESRDYPMKRRSSVSETLLAGAQCTEVLSRFGYDIRAKLENVEDK